MSSPAESDEDSDFTPDVEVNTPEKLKGGGAKKPQKSGSFHAGLTFPVGRVNRKLRKGVFADRISTTAGVYLAAVMEYLAAEVLEAAGDSAKGYKKKRITPRHIRLAVRNDRDLNKLLGECNWQEGGVRPAIHHALLPEKKVKKVKTA